MSAIDARAQVIGGVRVRSVGMLGGVLLEGEVGCVAAVAEERHATGRERHRGGERGQRPTDRVAPGLVLGLVERFGYEPNGGVDNKH